MRFVALFAGHLRFCFRGLVALIVGLAIKKAMPIKEIALEKNNNSIGKKPPNLVGTKEENRYRK